MAIRRLIEEGKSQNSVPWVNEYLNNGGKAEDATPLDSFIDLDDKILLLGEDFKACVWKKTSMYNFFIEAVKAYVAGNQDSPIFLLVAQKGGKVVIAIDDEDINYTWIPTDRGYRLSKKRPQAIGSDANASNPFLILPPTPRTRTRTRKEELPDVTPEDVPYN